MLRRIKDVVKKALMPYIGEVDETKHRLAINELLGFVSVTTGVSHLSYAYLLEETVALEELRGFRLKAECCREDGVCTADDKLPLALPSKRQWSDILAGAGAKKEFDIYMLEKGFMPITMFSVSDPSVKVITLDAISRKEVYEPCKGGSYWDE